MRARVVRVNVDQAAFRLGHDFLGDDKAVAVAEFGVVGGCDQFGEIVTGRTSPVS